MLLDAIKEYSVVMPELLQYLKKRGYDPGYFFTKLDLSLQFIIIFEFLLQNYDIVMITTPMSWVLELMLIELLTNKT